MWNYDLARVLHEDRLREAEKIRRGWQDREPAPLFRLRPLLRRLANLLSTAAGARRAQQSVYPDAQPQGAYPAANLSE